MKKVIVLALGLLLAGCRRAPEPAPARATPSPPMPKPIWSVFVGNDPKAIPQYEQWLGARTGGTLSYTGDKNWQDYEGSVGWAMGQWAKSDRPVFWSVSLIPKGATLADAAKGLYNTHYRTIAQKLANWHPAEPVLYIRTGWEFNGGWFHYKAVGQPENFIGAWRQLVDTFRSVSDRFRFDWCPAGCDHFPMKAEDAWPGDDYVDVIGLDVYDQLRWRKIKDPAERWDKIYLNGENGLKWHREFARKHGKPMSYPEWGAGGNEAGDNPYFIEQMHRWFLENKVLYASYWNSNASYKGRMSGGEYPKAGAKYKELFGGSGQK